MYYQQQPFANILLKRWLGNILEITKKTKEHVTLVELQYNSIEITQLQQCFLLNLPPNFRTSFQYITSGRLSLTPFKGETVAATKKEIQ